MYSPQKGNKRKGMFGFSKAVSSSPLHNVLKVKGPKLQAHWGTERCWVRVKESDEAETRCPPSSFSPPEWPPGRILRGVPWGPFAESSVSLLTSSRRRRGEN